MAATATVDEGFVAGDQVVLSGLISKPALNGAIAVVQPRATWPHNGRIAVLLTPGTDGVAVPTDGVPTDGAPTDGAPTPAPMSLKPANLAVVAHAPAPDFEHPCPVCLEYADDAKVQVAEPFVDENGSWSRTMPAALCSGCGQQLCGQCHLALLKWGTGECPACRTSFQYADDPTGSAAHIAALKGLLVTRRPGRHTPAVLWELFSQLASIL